MSNKERHPGAPLTGWRRGIDLYRQVRESSELEQSAFISEMLTDKETLLGKLVNAICEISGRKNDRIEVLLEKLKRHRKPARNAERDAEIMRLHRGNKSAGQIASALTGRWKVSDRVVTAVISRERKKQAGQIAR